MVSDTLDEKIFNAVLAPLEVTSKLGLVSRPVLHARGDEGGVEREGGRSLRRLREIKFGRAAQRSSKRYSKSGRLPSRGKAV